MKAPRWAYFQEVKAGDILKTKGESNLDSSSGGGARDLRIRPENVFAGPVGRFFPIATTGSGILRGRVNWFQPGDGSVESAEIEFWRPTTARAGELRIAKITAIGAWAVKEDEWRRAQAAGKRWYFLLVQDNDGVNWATLIRGNIDDQHELVRELIRRREQATRGKDSVRGFIDFEEGMVIP